VPVGRSFQNGAGFWPKSTKTRPEANLSVTRVEGNTKKIVKIRSILRLFLGPLVKGTVEGFAKDIRQFTAATYFKGVEGPLFFFVSSFYLAFLPLTHTQSYVLHNYVRNSDEDLTDPALF
jgi:hypothetical protein